VFITIYQIEPPTMCNLTIILIHILIKLLMPNPQRPEPTPSNSRTISNPRIHEKTQPSEVAPRDAYGSGQFPRIFCTCTALLHFLDTFLCLYSLFWSPTYSPRHSCLNLVIFNIVPLPIYNIHTRIIKIPQISTLKGVHNHLSNWTPNHV